MKTVCLWLSLLVLACGNTNDDSPMDAGLDAGLDAASGQDADSDWLPDAGSDGDTDTVADAGSDANGDNPALPAWPDDKYITPQQVYERVQASDADMLLLNVADADFYYLGHIPGSLKIPWNELSGRLDEVDKNKHVVIYCRRGVRSESAYTTLENADYELLWVMEGGIEDWIDLRYPTEI